LKCKESRKNLPPLPGLIFDKIKFSAEGMSADQVCQNIRVYRGNGVKSTVLSANSDFIPDKALERFDQERGLGSGKMIRIPDEMSITAISVTVSNRKEDINTKKPDLAARLGSPRGEKEKGEVLPTARKDPVEKEPRAAYDQEDRPRGVIEKMKRSDRCEDLDSSLDKPTKKKSRKSRETSSSSSKDSDSSDTDGEPMTKDRVSVQALKVELEMSKLLKYKKRYKREKQREKEREMKQRKKQSKSARDNSSE